MWKILQYVLQLLGFGTQQVARAQDVKAGHDAATSEMLQEEGRMLKEEIQARENAHSAQATIARDGETEKQRLRDDPNTIFGGNGRR
jgi:hypothetical protein